MMANKLTAAPKNYELSNCLINLLYLDWQMEFDIHDTRPLKIIGLQLI